MIDINSDVEGSNISTPIIDSNFKIRNYISLLDKNHNTKKYGYTELEDYVILQAYDDAGVTSWTEHFTNISFIPFYPETRYEPICFLNAKIHSDKHYSYNGHAGETYYDNMYYINHRGEQMNLSYAYIYGSSEYNGNISSYFNENTNIVFWFFESEYDDFSALKAMLPDDVEVLQGWSGDFWYIHFIIFFNKYEDEKDLYHKDTNINLPDKPCYVIDSYYYCD